MAEKSLLLITFALCLAIALPLSSNALADDSQDAESNAGGISIVFVRGGCFQMGDTFGDGDSFERPVHEVCLTDYYIGQYEVTLGQWLKVMGINPMSFADCDKCPVDEVSWSDAQQFIQRLNLKTGQNFRLPTEAEWEYAARSGGKNEKWAGTNSESELGQYALYTANSEDDLLPVGQKQPNGLGLYDMSGGVWEWVQDRYGPYDSGTQNNPTGPTSGIYRVVRGGARSSDALFLRASFRNHFSPDVRLYFLGFRLARTP